MSNNPQQWHVFLCDDEPLALDRLRELCQQTLLPQISAVFHYIPLHSAKAGREFGVFAGEDRYTTRDSERLLRLPLYYEMTGEESAKVIESVHDFFRAEK